MLRAGKLRIRGTIEQRGITQDASGDQSQTWTTFLVAYMSIIGLSVGRESVNAEATQNVSIYTVEMRYFPGITAGMRIRYGTRYFNIIKPPKSDEEGRNRRMAFEVQEGLKDG
jgi:head-tail adaptor